jgi:TRAP-type C4-dicarboxylate transport system permease large subunit
METVFKGCLPFLAALVAGAGLNIAWPGLATWLPRLMY